MVIAFRHIGPIGRLLSTWVRVILRVAALTLVICIIAPLTAQDLAPKARIAVVPLSNQSADANLDIVGHAVADTITLSLRLLGKYKVETMPGLDSSATPEALKAFADSERLDSIVTGSVAKAPDGSYLFTVRLFDRQNDTFTISSSAAAASVLDVFDAADNLTKSFLESLSGTHIGFGSVQFENGGEKGEYIVSVDGVEVGRNLAGLPKLLNGRHRIEVVQTRLFGKLQLASLDADIVEDETTTVAFAVPYMTDAEKAKVDGLFDQADKATYDRIEGDAAAILDELAGIVANSSWCPRWKELGARVDAMRPAANIMKVRFAVEAAPLAPDPAILTPLRPILAGLGDGEAAVGNRRIVAETADIEATLLEYAAAAAAEKRNWASVATIYDGMKGILDLADTKVAEYYKSRIDTYSRVLAAYLGKSIKPSKVAPWLIGGGLTLAAAGATIFATGLDSIYASKADALLSQYKAAADSTTATNLHDSISTDLAIANTAAIGKWVGVSVGTLLATMGGVSAARTNPKHVFDEYATGLFAGSKADLARFKKALTTRMTNWVIISPLTNVAYRVNDSTKLSFPAVIRPSADIAVRLADPSAAGPLEISAHGKRSQGLVFVDPWDVAEWKAPAVPREVLPGWVAEQPAPAPTAAAAQENKVAPTKIAAGAKSPLLRGGIGAGFGYGSWSNGDTWLPFAPTSDAASFWASADIEVRLEIIRLIKDRPIAIYAGADAGIQYGHGFLVIPILDMIGENTETGWRIGFLPYFGASSNFYFFAWGFEFGYLGRIFGISASTIRQQPGSATNPGSSLQSVGLSLSYRIR